MSVSMLWRMNSSPEKTTSRVLGLKEQEEELEHKFVQFVQENLKKKFELRKSKLSYGLARRKAGAARIKCHGTTAGNR